MDTQVETEQYSVTDDDIVHVACDCQLTEAGTPRVIPVIMLCGVVDHTPEFVVTGDVGVSCPLCHLVHLCPVCGQE